MTSQADLDQDPAAVFACAFSLWEECRKHAVNDRSLDLSAAYSGWDQLMREVMRIGHKFEQWAGEHVKFNDLGEVWPYLLGDRFGSACLRVMSATELASFDERECLQVALQLRLPLEPGENLRVPIDVAASNPVNGAGFKAFRIQTVRPSKKEGCVIPFTLHDDPFDEEYGPPFFGVYGITTDDELEHIADRDSYFTAVELAVKLAPGIHFPQNPVIRRNC